PDGARVHVQDITSGLPMLALMGPKSRALLERLSPADFSNEAFPFGTSREIESGGVVVIVLIGHLWRTPCTGTGCSVKSHAVPAGSANSIGVRPALGSGRVGHGPRSLRRCVSRRRRSSHHRSLSHHMAPFAASVMMARFPRGRSRPIHSTR
ncbi:MAG: hypothetical protein E2584_04525, partial [Microbacterium sp.]|nr:hypothetical protein [Microbacterium sp.]